MRYFLATAVFCFTMVAAASAQTLPLSNDNERLLDTALATLQMNRSDLWLPWDAVSDDPHRLDLIKSLFDKPLNAFGVTDDYATRLKADLPGFLGSMLPTLKLGNYEPVDYRNLHSAADVNRALGVKLDTLTGLVETVVLRQYLSALITGTDNIRRLRSRLDSAQYARLVQHADSMLLSSEESSTASVYELKKSEDESEKLAREFFNAAANVPLDKLYSEGLSLYEYYRSLLDRSLSLRELYTDNIKTIVINTRYGKIAIGGKGDDVYNDDFVFILDAGGNDIYALPSYSKAQALNAPVRCIIDLAGNDVYRGGNFTLGSGFFGVGLLFDTEGNDTYTAGNFSLGSGLFGFGIVEDFAGHDTYAGRTCTQGSGAFGIGMLVDRSGNDLYRCEQQAQGFGFTRGFGAIADFLGNDSYVTQSPFLDFLRYDDHFIAFTQGAGLGSRPIASGGIGMLFDYQGNDSYNSDMFGQGTSYWFSLGALYDEGGNDRYTSYQYSQGSAAHLCIGVLHDKGGNDHYYSHGVSQGCGHDIGFGGLLDEEGDDEYVAESLSMGGGNANAISLFIDKTGNDAYIARHLPSMMGYSDFRREYGLIGIFIDGGGKDLYADTLRNDTSTVQSTYGVFSDVNLFPKVVAQNDVPALTPPEEQRDPLSSTIDSLFIQGSAAPQKFQYNVNPARAKIIAMGDSALPFLASKFATTSARERLEMEDLLEKLYDKDTTGAMRQLLLDSLRSGNESTFSMSATIIGKKKVDSALHTLFSRLQHPNWRIRANAVMQIGKIGKPVALDTLLGLIDDPHPHVRMRAAYALGLLLPDSLYPMTQKVLREDNQLIRNSFINGLQRGRDTIRASFVMSLINNAPNQRAKLALLPLAKKAVIADTDAVQYQEFIRAQSEPVRANLYRELKAANPAWLNMAGQYSELEEKEELRALLPAPKLEKIKPEKKEKEKEKKKRGRK